MRRMKHVFMLLLALGMLAYAGAQPAQADLIMMTGGGWYFNNSNTNAYKDFTVGGETLRVFVESDASGPTHSLSYDTSAGFGVISDNGNSELLDSNGTGTEILTVTFSRNVTVTGYGMSDWHTGFGFTPKVYNFSPYQEIYLPTTGGTIDTNGYMTFTFTGKPVVNTDFLRFLDNYAVNNDALGLARLDVTVNGAPVPIPGALWLLGSGLMGLVALRRRMRK